jgi:hypothetical protein
MKQINNHIYAFLALVEAGLWEKDVRLEQYGKIDFEEIYRFASEQSVVGLVTAGFEHIQDVKAPQEIVLQCIGESLQLEQTNKAMNQFIGKLVEKMREADIYTLLVKGQAVAQCYEKPYWRSSGDVDLLLSDSNYKKAKDFLLPLSTDNKPDERYSKHLGMNIDQWYVEIHGTLRTGLSGRVDKVVDEVQKSVFYGGEVRSWMNGKTTVFLPSPDNDVFFVFTHFIKHFYKEGMNLRQICDWCRLLWTYRKEIDVKLLESRIRKAGLMLEWRTFAALAVEYLWMPMEAMPMYNENDNQNHNLQKKAERVLKHILKGEPYNKVRDTWAIAKIFPCHTITFAPAIFFNVNGLKIKERLFGHV